MNLLTYEKAPFVNIIGVADGVCNAKRGEKKETLSAHWRTHTHTHTKKKQHQRKTYLYRAAYAYKTP